MSRADVLYNEGLNRHIDECKRRIDNISKLLNTVSDANKAECHRNLLSLENTVNALEEYIKIKDLEEQGLLKVFPCNVGDTVYVDSRTIPTENMDFEEVKDVPLYFQARVVSFSKNCNGNYIKLKVKTKWLHEWVDPDTGPDSDYFEVEKYFKYPLSAIGKTVFLTQAEAEQKLKELKGKE